MKNNELLRHTGRRAMAFTILAGALFCAAPLAGAATANTSAASGSSYLLSSNQNVVSVSSGGFNVSLGGSSTAVPEPATWAMFGLGAGLIGVGVFTRRRRPMRQPSSV